MGDSRFRAQTGEIPVIGLSPLSNGAHGLRKIADDVAAACENTGFFYVRDHGVPPALVKRVFAANQAFHAMPIEKKLELQINQFYRGYVPFAGSTLKTSSIEAARKPNQSEQILFRHELPPDDPEVVAGLPLQGPNQWPNEKDLPGFRTLISEYMAACEGLARQLLVVFEQALQLPQGFFDPFFERPTTNLKLLHYPAQPADRPEDQYGAAPHTDFGFVTILAQDNTGGLEVRSRQNNWISAPVVPGTFVVNIGDVLARWTNGRFASTPHRVINRAPDRSRYSVPFFMDPNMNQTIECLPGCCGPDNPSKFEPVVYRDYIATRLGTNFPIRKR